MLKRLLILTLFLLLLGCNDEPPMTATPQAATIRPTAVSSPTNPATESAPTETAVVLPTATTNPNHPTSIEARLIALEALFRETYLSQSGWLFTAATFYDRPTPNSVPASYRALADTWYDESWLELKTDTMLITRGVFLVYDLEDGLWERSALLDDHHVLVIPTQTVTGSISPTGEPTPYITPHQRLLNDINLVVDAAPSGMTGQVTAWEEDGRYTVQIGLYNNPPVPAENNDTGQPLSGNRSQFVFDTATGRQVQQQRWVINAQGDETLWSDWVWEETAVVAQLPPLAAQTLQEAAAMLQNE